MYLRVGGSERNSTFTILLKIISCGPRGDYRRETGSIR